jgi:UDPglucose 6-dehydrogenase
LESNFNNITVVGAGYVGMSLAALLSKKNKVKVLDINETRVNLVNEKLSTVSDDQIDEFLKNEKLSLCATSDEKEAFIGADFIIIATPTNYDENKNYFDTSSVTSAIKQSLKYNTKALIVIKSTVPIGYTDSLITKFNTNKIIFSPEFLREGNALYDNLYPSRIIIGADENDLSKNFVNILKKAALKKDIKVIHTNPKEAEAIKLFANTYLAMRVAFFNELDSYSLVNKLDTKSIISGICLDDRIGNYYNNPSFGYGGYCLPKDTKQLVSNYEKIPNSLMKSIIESNSVRKNFLADNILKKNPKTVGFYKLEMKKNSDNFRDSAILGIIEKIKSKNVKVLIYEPNIHNNSFDGNECIKSIAEFKERSEIIVTNRFSNELADCFNKVFTRDLFGDC